MQICIKQQTQYIVHNFVLGGDSMHGYNPGMSDKTWRKFHELMVKLNQKHGWKVQQKKELKKDA